MPGALAALAVSMTLALLGAACGAGGGAAADSSNASADPVEWDFFVYVTSAHAFTGIATDFADDVRERTDGALDITVRPAGELPYGSDEVLRRVDDGSLQLTDAGGSFVAGDCPTASLGGLPFLVADFEEAEGIYDILAESVDECVQSFGGRVLATYSWPPQSIWGSGDTPQGLEDLRGMRIRQTGAEFLPLIEELGAEPVTIAPDELSGAMQRGIVDALITASVNMEQQGWHEFIDWGIALDMSIWPSFLVVQQDAYDELPADVQTEFDDAVADWQQNIRSASAELDETARDGLPELDIELAEVDAGEGERITEALRGSWEEWAARAGAEAGLAAVRDRVDK